MTGECIDGGYWYVLPVIDDGYGGKAVDTGSVPTLIWVYGDVALCKSSIENNEVMGLGIDPLSLSNPLPRGFIGDSL